MGRRPGIPLNPANMRGQAGSGPLRANASAIQPLPVPSAKEILANITGSRILPTASPWWSNTTILARPAAGATPKAAKPMICPAASLTCQKALFKKLPTPAKASSNAFGSKKSGAKEKVSHAKVNPQGEKITNRDRQRAARYLRVQPQPDKKKRKKHAQGAGQKDGHAYSQSDGQSNEQAFL